ncbi:MAG: hypothetical protein IID38_09670, partial [Planctomycetes bacterium]|nr:hypothetical protein [Planctomycetota bacterium]
MESRQRPAKDARQPSRRAQSRTRNASPKRSFIPADPGFSFQTHRALIGLALLTLLLNSLIFAPISWWPLAFVCLVPWLLFVGAADRAPRVYLYSYLFGLAFFLINMHWLYVSTGPGYVVLSIYLAAYFPLMACPVRHVVRRRRWPLALVFPFVWTGSELLRAVVISGFPWFFLSHSLHGVLSLIQISDLIGAYGVSFVVATVNGAIADWIIAWAGFRRSNKDDLCPTHRASVWRTLVRVRVSLVFAGSVVLAALIYGQVQLRRDTITQGPKIAILQGDFVSRVQGDSVNSSSKRRIYHSMLRAAAKDKPDLYLLPETPWIMYLNPEARDFHSFWRKSFAALQKHATRNNAYLVTGSASLVETPHDLMARERRYNSA